jgi:hypothetical protein
MTKSAKKRWAEHVGRMGNKKSWAEDKYSNDFNETDRWDMDRIHLA